MQEKRLREIHRTLAIWIVGLIIVQVISGLVITVGSFFTPHEHAIQGHSQPAEDSSYNTHTQQIQIGDIMSAVHHGGGLFGNIYRTFLALGILVVATTGIMIFFKIRSRVKKMHR